jgi:hypothetical protein
LRRHCIARGIRRLRWRGERSGRADVVAANRDGTIVPAPHFLARRRGRDGRYIRDAPALRGSEYPRRRQGYRHRLEVAIDGARIVLDEDMRNWPSDDVPLTGTLSGAEFSASYSVGADYLRWACQFKEATLSGRFSADFNSFEAMETLVWGPPNAETTVHRRWTVTRQ